ncbi:lyase family protein [Thermocatellispora tengchongensis]|uniref:lyase family protein n=1 Tax=Thermocatellispora tengchongensis TaxID=1073253 RepID=UPI0036331296
MDLFSGTFARGSTAPEVSAAGWLAAMLDVEAALAVAQAGLGLMPPEAAAAIEDACAPERYDVGKLAELAGPAGNPVIPLVAALREQVPPEHRKHVHRGATSQDVNDTAAMLVARRALAPLIADLDAIRDACAALADAHRRTVMAGRTVGQQAVPVTFGLKAAGWLTALGRDRAALVGLRLPVQYGGAAGTLSALGGRGHEVIPASPPSSTWRSRCCPGTPTAPRSPSWPAPSA